VQSRRAFKFGVGAALAGVAAAVSVVLVPTVAGAVPVPWKNCGGAGDVVVVNTIEASVWPPVHGQPLDLTLKAAVARAIPYATETVSWKLEEPIGTTALVTLRRDSFTAPFLLPGDPGFPIAAGPIDQPIVFRVPPHWPAGDVVALTLVARGSTGARLLCMAVTIPIK
jgi:hypothetical protein